MSSGRKSRWATPVVVHFNQVSASGPGLVGVASLCVAGIDGSWLKVSQHLPGMHVAECPVVDAGLGEVVEGAWRVCAVVGVVADVRMEKADPVRAGADRTETTDEVVVNVSRRVADAVDDGAVGVVLENGRRLKLRAEPVTGWRIGQPRLPAVKGVVVAMADEGAYAGIVKLLQTGDEPVLCSEAAVRAVVDVPGDQQRVHSLGNAQVNDIWCRRRTSLHTVNAPHSAGRRSSAL